MTFQIRHQLLQVLSNNVTAYEIAHAFIGDDADKFEVFKIALAEARQLHGNIETQSSAAVDVAEVRWKVLSTAVAE